MRVFVYGTLMRGGNNHALLRDQQYIGDYRTPPKYSMYDLGVYPAVLDADNGVSIKGEIWQVTAKTLPILDALEDVPKLYYRRGIQCGKYGMCHVYMMRKDVLDDMAKRNTHTEFKLIQTGDWNNT
jgi:gamma-glutamylcyclotransferase (GGCT)/AIG2-like uncharacterized protein YtfP